MESFNNKDIEYLKKLIKYTLAVLEEYKRSNNLREIDNNKISSIIDECIHDF